MKKQKSKPQSFEGIVGSAIFGDGSDRQRSIDAATLKMLVCQSITCPTTGHVLDQGSAVALEIVFKATGKTDYYGPYDPSLLKSVEKLKADTEAAVKKAGVAEKVSLKILNGKELF